MSAFMPLLIDKRTSGTYEYTSLLNELFELRSAATRGSDLNAREQGELEGTVNRCLAAYKELLTRFLALGRTPDWKSLELEPRTSQFLPVPVSQARGGHPCDQFC
jgi:hypothetical protein